MISIDIHYCLRDSLDGVKKKLHASRILLKKILREMLFDEGHIDKKDLLKKFSEKYPKISLPSRSKEILASNLIEEDFREILEFGENCMKYLLKIK